MKAPITILANELIAEAHAEANSIEDERRLNALAGRYHRTMLVFPGSIRLFQRGIAEGWLPSTAQALIFEERWRRVRRLDSPNIEMKAVAPKRGRIRRLMSQSQRALDGAVAG